MTLRELKSQIRMYLAREFADKNMLGNTNALYDYDIVAAINHAYRLFLDETNLLEGDDTKTFTDGIYNCAALNLIEIERIEIDSKAIGYLRWKDVEGVAPIDNDLSPDSDVLSLLSTVSISYWEKPEFTLSLQCSLSYSASINAFTLSLLSSHNAIVGPGGSFVSLGLLSSVTCTVY